MDNGVSYTSTKPLEEFEINKKNKPSDLISRLSELRSQYNCFDVSERGAYHTLSEAIKALQAQKTGKWFIEPNKGTITCSTCKEEISYYPSIGIKPIWDYCPYCGSLNRGEEE